MKKLTKILCVSVVMCALVGCGKTVPPQENNQYKLPPNVTSDMLKAEYWLDKNADKEIMTPSEIEAFNKAITEEPKTYTKDITGYGDTIELQEVISEIQTLELPGDDNFVNGAPTPAGYMQALDENRNMQAWENVKEITPRYAVIVRRTNMRLFPTADFIAPEGDTIYDELQNAELYWNQPVLVLNESIDKKFYFVQSKYAYGWVSAEDLALFGTKQEWLDCQNPKDFLVVATSRIRLDVDTKDERVSMQEVYLGNILTLAKTQETIVSGRRTYGNYVIEMPVRGANGNVEFAKALIPVNEDVHMGFLPYTQRNTLELAFTMLGQNYGWGGLDRSNDCSGYIQQVYAVMGFQMPRNSGSQASMPCKTQDVTDVDDQEKTKVIKKIPAGSLLQFPGHIAMYIGERNGNLYVINSLGVWADPKADEIEEVLGVAVNDLSVKRRDLKTWLSHFITIKIIDVE